MREVLTSALHGLMTAFTSFSAAIGSIALKNASEGQVTTVISNFETHIRDLTDEVSVSLSCSNYSSGGQADLGSTFVRRKKSMGGRSQRENFVWRGRSQT